MIHLAKPPAVGSIMRGDYDRGANTWRVTYRDTQGCTVERTDGEGEPMRLTWRGFWGGAPRWSAHGWDAWEVVGDTRAS